MNGRLAIRTGEQFQTQVEDALKLYGYSYQKQVVDGIRPHGGQFIHDFVITAKFSTIAIEVKAQKVSGTGDEKIPYAVHCYEEATNRGYDDYRIVLAGNGWRKLLVSWYLKRFPKVIRFENFLEQLRVHEIDKPSQNVRIGQTPLD